MWLFRGHGLSMSPAVPVLAKGSSTVAQDAVIADRLLLQRQPSQEDIDWHC